MRSTSVRWAVPVGGVVALFALAAAAGITRPDRPPPPAPAVPVPAAVASVSVPWPAAGALFDGPPDSLGDHFCSAAVVDTPAGGVVVTAAHCVADGDGTPVRTGMSFVPGYHDGVAPFGAWTVTAAAVDPAWVDDGDQDRDVAFLTVQRPGSPPVQQVTGGYHVVFDADPSDTAVDAIGYPADTDAPVVASARPVGVSQTQMRLDAPGLPDGTSGGPWLEAAGDVDLIGVTGGQEQGGLTPDTSFASVLSDAAAALFASAGGTPDRP